MAPSGPTAAPFGPPPHSATTSTRPSVRTRDSVPRRISTSSTLPSEHQIGPSGNWRPDASWRNSGTPLHARQRRLRRRERGGVVVVPLALDLAVLDLVDRRLLERHGPPVARG